MSYLNFHSSGNNINYDSKIVSTGGGATVGGATLSSYANIINLNALSTININPAGNLTLGSATSVNTFIKNR